MKLEIVKSFSEISELSKFTVYKLDKELRDKYKFKYILSKGIYSEEALKDPCSLIEELSEYYYEGKFMTLREIALHLRYVNLHIAYRDLTNKLKSIKLDENNEKVNDNDNQLYYFLYEFSITED